MKRILVTGATSGIGYALAQQLCNKGHSIIATGRNRDKLEELAALTGCHIIAADLRDPEQAVGLFEQAVEKLGGLDVLINNAGMNSRKCGIDEFTLEEFDYQYAVNLRAPALLSREALKVMKPARSGQIINVLSTVAKRSNETMAVYTAMKQGLAGFSAILMKEAQPHGIKVTSLFPGGADTNFREAERPQYMQPESVAQTISVLLDLPQDVVMHEMVFRPPVELE
ncbi:SDR family NAD(P)-dependent oxidoreductase [Photobacterium gaetbulicola]|uniref:Short-chain dehydrogenase/reductase SDR n=1 Tax=Photobacterium gaetbulicola Gung47 TaxID=658445 RepID=A0A0C5WRS8_9GAMM|nr:SDR family oxidoreductase [Photobacterium gaetbulicola]AJR09072.1 short-chain dehydrogenase/reductase SDR [Photobacterium gaetbulicola Gung47]PSU04808.1 SDR family NAD(P)-dependent oxidoreductase [Photobacterium gaetbulicola]